MYFSLKCSFSLFTRELKPPTVVSHLAMVVGLCTNDPKDF